MEVSECHAFSFYYQFNDYSVQSDYTESSISKFLLLVLFGFLNFLNNNMNILYFQDDVCTIAKVPFQGAPCSDAAGRQVPYKLIMKQVNSSVSGSQWDEDQQAPYYNYKVNCHKRCMIFISFHNSVFVVIQLALVICQLYCLGA